MHSQLTHLFALLEMAKRQGVENVFVHCFTDGRDKPPQSGAGYVEELVGKMKNLEIGKIATINGRYFAMDRDRRWERIERAFRAMVLGEGSRATDAAEAMRASYAQGVTDEFVAPVVLVDEDGNPIARIEDEDAVIFFNFRADRARQMTLALNDPSLERPPRSLMPKSLHYVTMTEYGRTHSFPHVISPHQPEHTLGQVCGERGWKNLRSAETEKYPHVTYFFNGGRERPLSGRRANFDSFPESGHLWTCSPR